MNENEAKEWDQEFVAAIGAGLYEKALAMLDKQIAQYPDVEGFYYGKAYILYHDLGRSSEAMIYVQKSLSLLPNDKSSLLLLGQIYLSLAQYQEALQMFEEVIKLDFQDQNAWLYKAVTYCKQNKYQEGLDAILQLLSLNPKHQGGLEYKVHCLVKLARYDEVMAITEAQIAENSEDIIGYFYKMTALYELAQYQEVLEYSELVYSKLSNLSFEQQVIYERDTTVYQSLALEALSRLKEVEEKLVNLLVKNPEFIAGLENLAFLYLRMKEYQEVLATVERIIAIDPKCQSINSLTGYANYYLMNYHLATQYFALAIRQDNLSCSDLEEILEFKGYSHEFLGENRLAIECYQELSKLAEQKAGNIADRLAVKQSSQVNIAHCLFRSGEVIKSESIIKQVLEISPDRIDALAMQARLLNFHGQYSESVKVADKIITNDPDYSYAYHARAVALFHLAKYQEAIDSFSQSFEPDIINPFRIERYQEVLNYLSKIITESLGGVEVIRQAQKIKVNIENKMPVINA